MRVLIVKTSSLGDVVHTLPALSDARRIYPDIVFDWVIEEAYNDIPSWHPAVDQVIPINLRQWRKKPWRAWRGGAWRDFKEELHRHYYDYIIDAQGLIKSGFLTYQALGIRCGLNKESLREPLAAHAYNRVFYVDKRQHAVERIRSLFAQVLDYMCPKTAPDYGIQYFSMTTLMPSRPTLLFLHGTTWASKHWPEKYWQELAIMAIKAGFQVRLPWGSNEEKARADRIAHVHRYINCIPPTNLPGLAAELSAARGVVGVDTGLSHLATALNVPTVSIYGATQVAWTGTYGGNQVSLSAQFPCAPCLKKHCHYTQITEVSPACYQTIKPQRVWKTLAELLNKRHPHQEIS